MLRSVLLYLSRNKTLRRWVETSPIADRLTSRFVAGHTIDQELATIERLDKESTLATVDYLGENVTSLSEAESTRDTYMRILDRVAQLNVGATISIKLTQFGLDLSTEACQANVEPLVARAKEIGSAVEIDMESHEYVDRTLDIALAMHRKYRCVRSVIQAYLYRSEKDIEKLCVEGLPVRLCKGAYREPSSVAFQKKSEVDASYVRLMHQLVEHGSRPAFATHDERMVKEAFSKLQSGGHGSNGFEFQMLYGIRRDLQKTIVGQGYRLRLYVPYGDAWYPYFMRRLAERPANLMFLMRNLVRK